VLPSGSAGDADEDLRREGTFTWAMSLTAVWIPTLFYVGFVLLVHHLAFTVAIQFYKSSAVYVGDSLMGLCL